jgi:hypothetical protein
VQFHQAPLYLQSKFCLNKNKAFMKSRALPGTKTDALRFFPLPVIQAKKAKKKCCKKYKKGKRCGSCPKE